MAGPAAFIRLALIRISKQSWKKVFFINKLRTGLAEVRELGFCLPGTNAIDKLKLKITTKKLNR